MNSDIHPDLTSVIVPCFNQEEFTRLCIRALLRHTRRTWELIVVNNGSTDDTSAYLRGVQDAAPVPVTVIRNTRNLGFPRAINQGLHEARGEYLVLLNNDAVVTDGWLDHLIGLAEMPIDRSATAAERDPSPPPAEGGKYLEQVRPRDALGIGLVGPMSNYATPPQLVEDVPYRDLDEMQAFARRWCDQHRGKWLTAPKLSGFCVLMKRVVYETIGGLDERFGLGLFDDDDLAERAHRAGFAVAIAHDLFVHHFGSRTFVGNGIDAESRLEENARRFADKWGNDVPQGRRVELRPWAGGPDHPRMNANPLRKVNRPRMNADGHRREDPTADSECHIPDYRDPTPDSRFPEPESSTGEGSSGTAASRSIVGSINSNSHMRSSALICGLQSSLVRRTRRLSVSLTMIVRDEEANLPHCLESARGIFDEIVVVDTGSVDRTQQIARAFGARAFEFAWIDDFAAARNAALSHATGDHAFWLDADDVLDPPEREKLRGCWTA